MIALKSENADKEPDSADADLRSLTIPWHKPPARRSRQILLSDNALRSDVRPEQFERRVRLMSTIKRGRQWLDDVVSGRVSTVASFALARTAAFGRSKYRRTAGDYRKAIGGKRQCPKFHHGIC